MRFASLLCCLVLATPAAAWDFSPLPICTMSRQSDGAETIVTYDPAIQEYAIHITLDGAIWPPSDVFAIRFEGGRGLTISTGRHVIDEGGARLTVRDRGFGNVLAGLEANAVAIAVLGDRAITVPLDGAAEAVADFRACGVLPLT